LVIVVPTRSVAARIRVARTKEKPKGQRKIPHSPQIPIFRPKVGILPELAPQLSGFTYSFKGYL